MLIIILSCAIIAYQYFSTPNEEKGSGNLKWHENFEEVVAEADSTGKPILINFTGSDWCPYCIMLEKEVFSKMPFEKWAEKNAVLFKCDFPRKIHQPDSVKQQNNSLAQKYGIQGFPTVLLIDARGNILAQSGYESGGSASWVKSLKSQLK